MQPIQKLRNQTDNWSALLRPRVNDVVTSDGKTYQNVVGYNGSLTDTDIWFPVPSASTITVDKVAGDIVGADPFYSLDLSAVGLPAFPKSFSAYVDLLNDGTWKMISPEDYTANTKVLAGMNSPTDYPNQKIKIIVS